MAFWILAEKSSTIIKIGEQQIEVKPLTLENSLRLVLLISPYIAKIETRWPEIRAALESTNGKRPKLLETIFMELRQDLTFAPGDIVTAFAICLDTDIAWVAQNASAKDLIEAWPVLDRVNNFRDLFLACKELGITVKYGN